MDESGLKVTSVFTKRGEHAVIDHVADADEEVLVALGYKQEFKRSVDSSCSFRNRFMTLLADKTC